MAAFVVVCKLANLSDELSKASKRARLVAVIARHQQETEDYGDHQVVTGKLVELRELYFDDTEPSSRYVEKTLHVHATAVDLLDRGP